MKTLHFYLTRQMLATLGMTVFVVTFVLLLGNVIKEILNLLIHRQATLPLALHAILLLIPFVLAFALPIGMLTAALLVFGRFSADQELMAARASGISLLSLITPILLLSVAVSGLCAWLNFDIAPASRVAYNSLLYHAETRSPSDILQPGEPAQLGNYTIWAAKKEGTNLDDVLVTEWTHKGGLKKWFRGLTGTLFYDSPRNQIILTLHSADGWLLDTNGWVYIGSGDPPFVLPLSGQEKTVLAVPVSDMTFRQLRAKLAELQDSLTPPAPLPARQNVTAEGRREVRQIVQDASTPYLVYLHREVAFSFACIGFTLVGIPLGIRAHRRETTVGVTIALALMLIYYSFVVLGQAWVNHPERAPYLIVWLPNFIFQAVGAVLLWRANRSG
jgi:lipopolysaccharide export system permease protein